MELCIIILDNLLPIPLTYSSSSSLISSFALKQKLSPPLFNDTSSSESKVYYTENLCLNQWLKWSLDPDEKYSLAFGVGFEDYILWNMKTINSASNRKSPFQSSEQLFYSCMHGLRNILNLLIEHGANDWDSGLRGACAGGHLDLVKLMINKGATFIDNGFALACEHGHLEIVEMLFGLVYNINDSFNICLNLGLYAASIGGHINIVDMMLARGATNLNDALYLACESDHLNIINLLISKGANNLIRACRFGNIDIVKIMFSHGAEDIETGLSHACFHGYIDIVKFLCLHSEDIILTNGLLMYMACKRGDLDILKFLISIGGTVVKNSLLLEARKQRKQNIIEFLSTNC